ncbi:cysteine-rich CWC family protein [Virgibacillus tibetensis]|uniref:cysteine-rich CWC family protein n=1 Tax=Virgibacillus tibetensis TaxID=3042313 RepID=UPI00389A03C7
MQKSCPICGELNNCEMNNPDKACWCTTMSFPANIFEKISEADVGRVCVCKNCVENAEE